MKMFYLLLGLIGGVLNGLLGSGGGTVVVPLLEKSKIPPQKAHATSIAIILPLSLITAIIYYFAGNFKIFDSLIYIPGGIAGAVLGAFLLKKLPNNILRRIFGIIIIFSSVRILLR